MYYITSSYVFLGILTTYAAFKEIWVLVGILAVAMGVIGAILAKLEVDREGYKELCRDLREGVWRKAQEASDSAHSTLSIQEGTLKTVVALQARIETLEASLKDLGESANLAGWGKVKRA